MSGIMTQEVKSRLEIELTASRYLLLAGWNVYSEVQNFQGKLWRVYFANHASYPPQRAISVLELVKRCVWQEDNRIPRRQG